MSKKHINKKAEQMKRWKTSLHEASHFIVGYLLNPDGVGKAGLTANGGVTLFLPTMCKTHLAIATFAGAWGEQSLSTVQAPTLGRKKPPLVEDFTPVETVQKLRVACDTAENDMVAFAKMCLLGNEACIEDYVSRRVGLEYQSRDLAGRARREIVLAAKILFTTGELRRTDMKTILGN